MKALFCVLSMVSIVFLTSCEHKYTVATDTEKKMLQKNLTAILVEDQNYRQQLIPAINKHGQNSLVVRELLSKIRSKDSVNVIKVTAIIDKYGWLGSKDIGEDGNSCLFLVIQHSGQKTQEKYLPILRSAVKQGKALGSDLAFLEDRVALKQGRKQLYGSQLYRDSLTNEFHFAPIEDELNVNYRRKKVGLGTIEERASEFGFQYKPLQN